MKDDPGGFAIVGVDTTFLKVSECGFCRCAVGEGSLKTVLLADGLDHGCFAKERVSSPVVLSVEGMGHLQMSIETRNFSMKDYPGPSFMRVGRRQSDVVPYGGAVTKEKWG